MKPTTDGHSTVVRFLTGNLLLGGQLLSLRELATEGAFICASISHRHI